MAKNKLLSNHYNAVEQAVWLIAEPVTAANFCEVVDIEYTKEGGLWYLRIYIDRDEPVDHYCCQAVSEAISDILDAKDPIPHSYILEVSSPGIERVLKKEEDFIKFAGHRVLVKLYKPLPDETGKEYQGILIGLSDDDIVIEIKEKNKSIEKRFSCEQVAKIHLVASL
jgi:ribosome maturation factor RimP